MGPDSFRRALRTGTPWLFFGCALLAIATAAPAALSFDALRPTLESWSVLGALGWLGLCGALLTALGALTLARGRRGGHASAALGVATVCAWFELALRAWAKVVAPLPSTWLALRLFAWSLFGFALCLGLLWFIGTTYPSVVRRAWRQVRAAFALQISFFLAVPLIDLALHAGELAWSRDAATVPGWLAALGWIVFALPSAMLLGALHRTSAASKRTQNVSDVLLGN